MEIGAAQPGDSGSDRGIESLGQANTQSDVLAATETGRPEPETGSDGRSFNDFFAGNRSIDGDEISEPAETCPAEPTELTADDDWELERSRR